MLKKIVIAGVIAAPFFWAAPAFAQAQELIIYGDDKCPTNANGEEIVVCRRLDESERFRLPKDLREGPLAPQKESWAVRQESALTEGATGTGSCSTVGASGGTGCYVRQGARYKAERKAEKQEAASIPLP